MLDGLDLSDRTILITGATSGLGHHTALCLAAAGARVVLAIRDVDKAHRLVAALDADTAGRLDVVQLDVASLASVRAGAGRILDRYDRIHVLINNAGVMAVPFTRTVDGIEMQLATNHVGHFLLTNLLLPALAAPAHRIDVESTPTTSTASRVVNVTSRGHRGSDLDWADPNFERRPYDRWQAYGQSKTAQILFTIELERRFAGDGVHALAVHPGMVKTNMATHLTRDDLREMVGRVPGRQSKLKTVEQGAASICWAATSPALEGIGGVYIENCHPSGPTEQPDAPEGHAPWATDAGNARRLWELSLGWAAAPQE